MSERTADIDRARDALARQAWAEVLDALQGVDPDRLSPQDLEGFADAAWWMSRWDGSTAARQRAYAGYAAAGQDPQAGFNAVLLCFDHLERGDPSVAMGWLMRAQRHLADHEPCFQQGFLALCQAAVAQHGGDLETAMTLAERAHQIGGRFDHRDVIALALLTRGQVLISMGRVAEGLALLDEAMTSVIADELTPYFTGVLYCSVLDTCLDIADLGRAGEWSRAAATWCETLPRESAYPGRCRVTRAEVAALSGAWADAEREARHVSEDAVTDPPTAGRALYQCGEIMRRTGDLRGAEDAFSRAHGLGFDPQPGLALLRLAQGKADAASTSLRVALGGEEGRSFRRVRLLSALVEIALALGDVAGAADASGELSLIAGEIGTPALKATAATARGAVRLTEGASQEALDELRRASAAWSELKLPYESARTRALFGVAVRNAGDAEGARLELRAARAAFERLGARPDALRAAALIDEPPDVPAGLTAREIQVLRLVGTGMTNRDIAATLVISQHTVARHLQNIYAKLGVPTRAAATAFAFEHGLA
ncbi:MAG: LuxR family transcriptional regulator [Actinobacteria bacterium]|nr:MAG: LuxR family transcriptional regulator [Actinomycetota bacterium]